MLPSDLSSIDPRIPDLLLEWEESCEQGRPLAAEDLCRHCPELIAEVRRRMQALQALAPVLHIPPPTSQETETAQPPQGTAPTLASSPAAPAAPSPLPAIPGYELLRELGRGGMGIVFEAKQTALDRTVALKMMLTGPFASAEQRQRFRVEVEAVARIHHPNIVQIHEVGEVDGRLYCALEYVDGGNLADKLDSQPQPPRLAADLLATLAAAVHAAHACGIIHRDLKPQNILLQAQGSESADLGSPKIADFGLAKHLDRATLTESGMVMGTPSYMAPEQATGQSRLIGPAVDIYALGAILYEMLTGRPPILGATTLETLNQIPHLEPVPPRRLQPRVPRDLETICLKCLRKEPERRYASAHELAEDLHRFLRGEPIQARPTPAWERAWKWARRRPAVAALVGVSAAAAIAFVLVGAIHNSQLRAERHEADRQRAEAEANFKLAIQVVDEYTEKLSDEEHAEDLRRELLQCSLTFYEEFVKQRGDDLALRVAQGRAYVRLARITSELGAKEAKAIPLGQQAVAIFDRLHHDAPDNAAYQRDLALAHYEISRTYRDLGQYASAEKSLQQALALQQPLLDRHSKDLDYRRDLARTYFALGLTCFDHKCGRERVEANYRQALALLNALPQPKAATDEDLIGDLQFSLGNLHRSHGEYEQAKASYQQALAIEEKLVQSYPGVVNYQSDLANSNFGLATIDSLQGRPKEAWESHQKARAIREQLARARPATTQFAVDLGNSYRALGHLANTPQARYDWYTKAIGTLEAVLAKEPKHHEAREHLGDAYFGRGRTSNRLGKPEDALADWKHAAALDKGQSHLYRLGLAESLARLERYPNAVAEVAPLANDKLTAEQSVDLARIYALCAKDEKLAKDCASRAIAVLAKAKSAGLFATTDTLTRLQQDPDFAAVRDLPEFQKLLK